MDGVKIRLGIVVSRFNGEITSKMLSEAKKIAAERGAELKEVLEVPGAYEIPFAVRNLLIREDIDAVATLGAVIKGETKHDEAIMGAICNSLSALSLEYGKPVGLGICGPGATYEQAEARISDYAERAVGAALEMAKP